MQRDSASLLDMYQAGQKVLAFTQGITLKKLQDDDMRLSAVLYEIIVIGEATTRLSPDFRVDHPEILGSKCLGCEIFWFTNMMRSILICCGMQFCLAFLKC